MSARRITTEVKLWDYMAPHMRGKWWRTEYATPAGLSDAKGLWQGQTHHVELKIGRPSVKALRSAQHEFVIECLRHGVPIWVVFWWKGAIHWFPGLPYGDGASPPAFWRP